MGKILKNVRLYAAGVDLTGESNKLEFGGEAEERDVTTFGSYDAATDRIWQELIAGQFKGSVSAGGFIDTTGGVDAYTFSRIGQLDAVTVGPEGVAVGGVVYFTDALLSSKVGLGERMAAAPWSAKWASNNATTRGLVAHPPGTARTATGTGTAVQHVAVPAGGKLRAAAHVLSVAGSAAPTITLKVQSSVDNTFAAPTDRITFDPATLVGGQVKEAAGPITDTWYRAQWTISGTTPSFLFLLSFGVVANP
jgi:hypothetical protein